MCRSDDMSSGGNEKLVRVRKVGCHVEVELWWHDCRTSVIPVEDLTKLVNCVELGSGVWSAFCVII